MNHPPAPPPKPQPQPQNASQLQSQSQSQPQSQPFAVRATSEPGLRYPSNKKTIYDRNLNRSRTAESSRAAFAYLFLEMVQYAQRRVTGIADLERRLNTQAYPLGLKLLDLLLHRSAPNASAPPATRPTRLLGPTGLLQFITTTLWRHLFGRAADALERSATNPAEYMISDNEPLVNLFVSVPREISQLNCAAWVAGIVEGVCDGAGFATGGVSAHWVGGGGQQDGGAGGEGAGGGAGGAGGGGTGEMWPGKTVFLIRFREEVLEREEILGKGA